MQKFIKSKTGPGGYEFQNIRNLRLSKKFPPFGRRVAVPRRALRQNQNQKGSIHEHPIPTNPKNPEWYVKAYHQSPGKQKFLHDYADDLYKHGIIEDADRRCCITQESRSALAEGSVSSPPPFAAILPWILRRVHQTIAVPGCPILS